MNNILDCFIESWWRFHPANVCAWELGSRCPIWMMRPVHILWKAKSWECRKMKTYFGEFIDINFNFDKHISSKTNKANSVADLIRRSFEYLDAPMLSMLDSWHHRRWYEYGTFIVSCTDKEYMIATLQQRNLWWTWLTDGEVIGRWIGWSC